jgi:hypothetical protein
LLTAEGRQSQGRRGGREALGIDHPDEGGHFTGMIDHCEIDEL